MYLESPEYIKYSFGFSHFSTSVSSLNKIGVSPKRDIRRLSQNVGTSQPQTGLFGNALMNVFSSQYTDGQFFGNLDSSKLSVSSMRRNQKDRFGNILNDQTNRSNRYYTNTGTTTTTAVNDELLTNQHVIGIKHLPETTQQLDLSQCNVYIRGLSRPEVVSQSNNRHPLGLITTSTINPLVLSSTTTLGITNLHSNQTNHLPASMNRNILSNNINNNNMTTPISSSTTAVRDISYRNKISNELNNLINPSIYNNSFVSSSLPQLSTQFMFNVITEIVINGYLIAQPFLRNSKLLYSFLTSNEPFNTNIFELNLGRLVKSVPLKLTKEKGQFLDNFLSAYFSSCHPQPIESDLNNLEMIKLKSSSIHSTTETGSYSTSFNPLLNTTNNHISSTNNVIDDTTFHFSTTSSTNVLQDRNLIHKSNYNNFKVDTYPVEKHIDYYSRYVLNSPQHKHQSRTSLDHRLRSRIYWNNAGLTYEKQKDTINQSSNLSTVHLTSLSEIILYFLDKIITLLSTSYFSNDKKFSLHSNHSQLSSHVEMISSSSSTTTAAAATSFSSIQRMNSLQEINIDNIKSSIDPWDITNPYWNEAFLNGPSLSNVMTTSSPPPPPPSPSSTTTTTTTTTTTNTNHIPSRSHQSSSSSSSSSETRLDPIQSHYISIISINFNDIYDAIYEFYLFIIKQCQFYFYYLIYKIIMILFIYFKSSINYWLMNYFIQSIYEIFSDENFAHILNNIKTSIFFHSSKKTDMDKSERKEKARIAIEKAILKSVYEKLLINEIKISGKNHSFTQSTH
uniref:Sorting nexin-14 n=1 Tax=Schistosoma haematobium TaxID=6185 RepID=A0A094ZSH0_SCHHA